MSTWVQCDRCDKWRRVRMSEEEVPEQWWCELNDNKPYASCAVPEEQMGEGEGLWGLRVLAAQNVQSPKHNGLRVAFCPDTLRVLIAGASQTSGYAATTAGDYSSIFASPRLSTSVSVVGGLAALATTDGAACGFSSLPGAAWQQLPGGGNSDATMYDYSTPP